MNNDLKVHNQLNKRGHPPNKLFLPSVLVFGSYFFKYDSMDSDEFSRLKNKNM